MTRRCEWFALCHNPATALVDHPILGAVPVCDRCRERFDLTPTQKELHTMTDRTEQVTDEFCMIWQNDQAVYNEVVGMTRDLLRLYPGMTRQTLGRNLKDRLFAWAYGGGWGYSSGWGGAVTSLRDQDRYPSWEEGPAPAGYRATPFSYFLDRDDYGWVSEERVADEAIDALGLEGYDEKGNRK